MRLSSERIITKQSLKTEFTIFPAFRQKHFVHEAVNQILAKHPGKWEINYNEKNSAGKKLWNDVVAPFNPQVFHLDDEETVLIFFLLRS